MERDCESELSKLNIEQNACIYHFGASVIHGQRSNILRLRLTFTTFHATNQIQTVKNGAARLDSPEFLHILHLPKQPLPIHSIFDQLFKGLHYKFLIFLISHAKPFVMGLQDADGYLTLLDQLINTARQEVFRL